MWPGFDFRTRCQKFWKEHRLMFIAYQRSLRVGNQSIKILKRRRKTYLLTWKKKSKTKQWNQYKISKAFKMRTISLKTMWRSLKNRSWVLRDYLWVKWKQDKQRIPTKREGSFPEGPVFFWILWTQNFISRTKRTKRYSGWNSVHTKIFSTNYTSRHQSDPYKKCKHALFHRDSL